MTEMTREEMVSEMESVAYDARKTEKRARASQDQDQTEQAERIRKKAEAIAARLKADGEEIERLRGLLKEAHGDAKRELDEYLTGVCLLDRDDLTPIRETMDPEYVPYADDLEKKVERFAAALKE